MGYIIHALMCKGTHIWPLSLSHCASACLLFDSAYPVSIQYIFDDIEIGN